MQLSVAVISGIICTCSVTVHKIERFCSVLEQGTDQFPVSSGSLDPHNSITDPIQESKWKCKHVPLLHYSSFSILVTSPLHVLLAALNFDHACCL